VLGTGALSSGTASITVSTLAAGNDSISANYAGDNTSAASFGTVSQKVIKNNTTTTLSSSLNPSTVGQAVTFTATVTSTAGSIPDGETVTFKTGPTVLGTSTLSSGTASITVSTLAAGNDSISAAYGGDSTFSGSGAALNQKVNQ
jgi:hypothetical protein